MKKIVTAFFLALAILNLTACKDEADSATVSANDLLAALGGTCYERTLPDDFERFDEVYLGLMQADGSIRNISGGTGYEAGETLKVFVFDALSNPTVAILGNRSTSKQKISIEARMSSLGETSGAYDVPMTAFSPDNKTPSPDDIFLVLSIEKHDQAPSP